LADVTLYTSPRACSSGCHVALAESGLDYDIEVVKIREGRHREPAYLAINPWGRIPAMRIGTEVLTEAHAILSWIGDCSPNGLLPRDDALARARAHEWMNFLSATVHVAFRPLFKPEYLVGDAALYPKLRETGIPALNKALGEVDRRLAGRRFALGDDYSVVDPYLLVFWIWSQRDDVIDHVAGLPNWRDHAERMFGRPATWDCLHREGVTLHNITDP